MCLLGKLRRDENLNSWHAKAYFLPSVHVQKSFGQDAWSKISWTTEKSFGIWFESVVALEKWIQEENIFSFVIR